jgi:hypothetical protein
MDAQAAVKNSYSFEEFMHIDIEKPTPVVEGLLMKGHFGILAGPYAIGKTYLLLPLIVSLATGQPFMGRRVDHPYRVSFIDTENGTAEIKDRMARFLEAHPPKAAERELLQANWRYTDATEPGELYAFNLEKKGFPAFEEYIAKYEPEVLIVDCYGKVVPWDERQEEKTKELMANLTRCQRQYKSLRQGLILFPHHVTKPTGDVQWPSLLDNPRDFMGRARGTGRLLDFSQIRLGFDKERVSGESIYVVNGFSRSAEVTPLILERNPAGFFEPHSDSELKIRRLFDRAPKQLELFNAIREELRRKSPIAFGDIEKIPPSQGKRFYPQTVADTLNAACGNNLLRKHGERGPYSLPEAA